MIDSLAAMALALAGQINPQAGVRSPQLGLGFSQSGKRLGLAVSPDQLTTTVTLRAGAFKLHFPTSPGEDDPEYMICWWTDTTIFASIPIHKAVDDVDDYGNPFNYFWRYATIIDDEEGSGSLFLNNEGHQFFWDKRLTGSAGDYSATLHAIWQDDGETPLTAWHAPVYGVAWLDKNRNGIVDTGEYEKLVLTFTG